MWSIESIHEGTESSYPFLVGVEYIVGRKDCPILIAGDTSISRKHASFKVKHPESNLNRPNVPSILILKESSKYGTSCNGAKLETGSETSLHDGDVILFGSFNSNKWRVCFNPLVVAASALPADEKKALKQTVHKIGGHVVSEWCPQCTYLVMSQLNVTIKVISALVACRPIVTPDFFKKTLEAVKVKASLPAPGNYLPTLAEAAINKNEVSFSPDDRRKEIFKDRTFFFLTEKQHKRLHVPIAVAGGRSVLLDEDSDVPSLSDRLISSTSCVLYTEHQDSTQQMSQMGQTVVSQVLRLLKKHNVRPIPESELGLAVIYISTALHCNPKVAQAGLDLLSAVPSQSLATQNVLASDTESLSQKIHGVGGKLDRKATATAKKETAPTPNLPKQNLTSTPKVSKVSETIIATPSRTANQTASSRPLDGSPEFSLQEKAPIKMETGRGDDKEEQVETSTRPEVKKKDEKEDEGIGEKENTREEKQVVRVKKEALSQPNGRGDADGVDGHGQKPASAEVSESLEVISEQPSRIETLGNKEAGSKPKQRQQGTLDAFRKPLEKSEKPDGKMKGRAGMEEESRRVEDVNRVKEEPMDEGETDFERIVERDDDDEEAEEVEDDPFHYERKKPKKTPEAGRTEERMESKAEQKVDGGKRSSKRTADWSDENDGESSRAQTSRENDGGGMWKKKARIDVFSQEEEAAAESSQSQEDEPDSRSAFSEDAMNLPRGFISARIPIEDQVSVKIEKDYMQEEGLPSKLIKVTNAALVIRKKRNPPRRAVQELGSGRQVKNFKKFRKAGYAGQSAIPRIIGGNDLFTHYNNPSKDIEDMFNEEVRAEKKKDKQEVIAEKLFAFEPRRGPASKRKR
ncbi:nibrin isoform X1 [Strongylocentrotus purpuratus]|uniref:Nibrin n=2 Tax=Strongylocentrotus purpuratus TaxID=7668 RepID=A0A7M7N5C7_STRPU|nr:nibrin isoform X1 [Strongylocentrotus purpuratus]